MEMKERIAELTERFKKEIYDAFIKKLGLEGRNGTTMGGKGIIFLEDGFFDSFWNPDNYETFFRRYERNREAIKTISKNVAIELGKEIKEFQKEGNVGRFKVFIESGSTTAGLGPSWVKYARENESIRDKVEFLTNNLFILNALVGPENNVAVTPGPLLDKYLAFLPFSNNELSLAPCRNTVSIE